MPKKSLLERFAEKYVLRSSEVFPQEPCWHWIAATGRGYGVFMFSDKLRAAHRGYYELLNGPVPTGLELDHVCKNRLCVNPKHLEPVTHSENCRRGRHSEVCKARGAAVTHCPQGHEYVGENLYVKPNGRRECRQCVRDSGARYRARRKAAKVVGDTDKVSPFLAWCRILNPSQPKGMKC